MKNQTIVTFFITLVVSFSSSVFGQKHLLVPKKTEKPPVIDALLDDAVWEDALVANEFSTYWPTFDRPYPYKTEVFMAYTDEDLYFAFKCFDPEPDKIKSTLSARDKIRREDWVCVILDPFNDQQSFYAFYSNALGIQMDAKGTSSTEDTDTDFVYYSSGKITDEGYVIEMRIPFKSLRYKKKEIIDMGIMFERRIQRHTLSGTSPAMDPQKGMNFFTQLRPMQLKEIKHYTLIELLPAVTYSRISEQQQGNLKLITNKPDFSLTGKLGISSQLTLDLTYNPDFSQVESDAGQVEENQRYSLYYPEKRPFFQEGSEIFELAAVGHTSPLQSLVHTRQIINPLTGVKLSGKTGPKGRVAVLYALDEGEEMATTAGKSHFLVSRYQQALKEDSYVGFVSTSRMDPLNTNNHVVATDARFRLKNAASLEYHVAGSSTLENDQTQQDIASGISYRQSNNDRMLIAETQHIGENFQTNSGYMRRNGLTRFYSYYTPHFNVSEKFITRISPLMYGVLIRDMPSGMWEYEAGIGAKLVGERSLSFTGYVKPSTEIYRNVKFNTSSIYLYGSIQINPQWLIMAEYSYGKLIRYVTNPYGGKGKGGGLVVSFQPTTKFNSTFTGAYRDFYNDESGDQEFNTLILRSKNTFQFNKYLFVRAIGEYNSYRKDITTDFLVSFTYIPGTVIHLGYGSLYEKRTWNGNEYTAGEQFLEM